MSVRALLAPLAAALVLCSGGSPAPAAPAPAPAAKPGIPVSNKALAVVRVSGVGTARDRLTKLIEAAVPDLAGPIKAKIDEAFKNAADGRDLTALTPDAPIYLAANSFENLTGANGEWAVLLPAADYKAFREKLLSADERKSFEKGKNGVDQFDADGKTVFLVDLTKSGYVAATMSEDTAEHYAKSHDMLTLAKAGGAVAEAFLQSDVGVYVNLDAINEKYGEQIRQFRQLFHNIVQMGGGGQFPGVDKSQLDTIKLVYDGLFQAVEDGKGLALGVTFQADGLRVRGEMAFTNGTDTGKLFANEKPTALDELGTLPKGHAVYTAGRFGADLAAVMRGLGKEFAAGADEDKAIAAIAKYSTLYSEAMAGGWIGTSSGTDASLNVLFPKDAKKLAAAELSVLRTLPEGGRYQNVVIKNKPVVKEAAEEYAGFTLARAQIILDFEASVGTVADENVKKASIESMKRFVNEKTTFWFGTDGKRFVQVVAKDWEAAKKLLDEYTAGKSEVKGEAAFEAARKQLPAAASQVVLAEVGQTIATFGSFAKGIVAAMPGFPGANVPDIKPLKGAAPVYAGVALVLNPGAAGFNVFVPAEAVAIGRKMIVPAKEEN
ncbi:hypothetical protein [Fimbriiglobus ruber]|uniref:DUF3352 domain-containing protein n=1 Tax=Fimbriiglobus ruber TaxID=1908690 RepID=A0A225D526_9BACT|nr:hypothetical protein [Fimbriiglobus ruber]OWK36592.1 hypothetical protein FRUB_09155 [Fimbriiglobus ruber]